MVRSFLKDTDLTPAEAAEVLTWPTAIRSFVPPA